MSQYFYTLTLLTFLLIIGLLDALLPFWNQATQPLAFWQLAVWHLPSTVWCPYHIPCGRGTINVCWIKSHFLNHQLNNNIFLKKGNGARLIDDTLGFLVLFIFLSIVLNKNVTCYRKIKCRLWLTIPLCQLSSWISITVIFFFKKTEPCKITIFI